MSPDDTPERVALDLETERQEFVPNRKPPASPTLEQRQVEALERIAKALESLVYLEANK
jgi:hypothetical protein